jgi:gliding motility-associated-like protein
MFSLSPGPAQNVICYGQCNGSLSVYANNGYSPITYQWSNNDTTSSINNLCPDTYSVTVNDGIGCNHSLNFTITQPPLLVASITPLTLASCNITNPNTGSIVVTPAGGTPGYTYHWNLTSADDSLIQNLYSGHYIVTVTDTHGCDTILSTDIIDQSNLAIQATSQSTQCYGYCDGNAQVIISTAGVPPYTYQWNTGSSFDTISNLCSGNYVITVTDSEFCVRVQGVFVYQPDSLQPKVTIPGIQCFGGTTSATGSVISGGTPSYTYSWSTGETGSTISNLVPGNYFLYVTDSHGCKDTLPFVITQPSLITHSDSITPTACALACNGTIQLSILGGTPPFTTDWSNGSHSFNLQNLCPGVYLVTVTDHNGCTFTDQYTVGISDYLPFVDATTNTPIIYIGQTANLFALANPNYTFTWLPSGAVSGVHLQNPTSSPTTATTYQVIIEDAWGCTNTDSVTINVMEVICSDPYIYVPNAFTPNGDNKNDILYVKADIASELYFAIYDRWGEMVFSTTSVDKGWNGTYKGKPLDPAVFVYYIKVTCIDKMQFEKKGNITLIR